jgi:hypothetical protein
MKPRIVFFSRSYQAKLFPLLNSGKYESIYVTLTKKEKLDLEKNGHSVKYCFETYRPENDDLVVPSDYLITSFLSDRFLHQYKLKDRIAILKKEISFWRSIFEIENPISVINEQVAIEISEVMFIEAQKQNVIYLSWMTNPVNGYFFWVTNPMSLSIDQDVFFSSPSKESIQLAKEYLRGIIDKNERPYYLIPYLNQSDFRNLVVSSWSLVKLILRNFIKKSKGYEDNESAIYNQFERSLKRTFLKYNNLDELGDFEIVLYPLHYEPEASLSYLSEFFSNQVALIENISKCLAINQILVVKEHPAQPGMLLTKKFQKVYHDNSSLYYLSSTVVSYDIIKKSKVIITLTSHLGWEALILGKPVYLLGKMFYDKYPYINKFVDFEILRNEIRDKSYRTPDPDSLEKYIAQLIEISYEGKPFPCSELYEESNISNIIFAIEHKLGLTLKKKNMKKL